MEERAPRPPLGPERPEADLAAAQRLVRQARRVLALTGAGISTDSGIPDFRGPAGLWTKDPTAERRSSIHHYLADPELRRSIWRDRLARGGPPPAPNAGHRALVDLERQGRLLLLVTQNTDGLHLDAGHDPARVVELHGTSRAASCLDCGTRWPMAEVLAWVAAGEDDPHCPCGGLVKAATVSFGQALDRRALARAEEAAEACDLLLAVGSTLAVYPAAALVPRAAAAGASVVIVNGSPTAMDDLADVVVRGPISTVLPALVAA
ncbi:SIR2 family NAD-dependent protein deacylase [Aciditerrimonas ferrireducens]|jgi:NAD-dependent deacetylase|uniref:SIR2 family NAD-dependent protein deacylase n=1 Tax=Aciditerrimonas ferrireducens TaxID=667306 RepID=UPI0020032FDF|nr:Sir2 family NAD-dependent protein deacetylase [Aciditerrimonas ferrireducens]MCK4176439.1 NAD-dependent deacetylase [Aciditerrimonas ferrireducens]